MLLRRYIGQRLAAYYAQSADAVVGGVSRQQQQRQPLSSLWGRWHWLRVYQRLYRDTAGQWLTPVELFQPHYSRIIGDYIIQTWEQQQSHNSSSSSRRCLDIIELGGGRGTHARHVMEYLQSTRPDVYDRVTTYHMVDASPSLINLQQQTIRQSTALSHDRFQWTRQDLLSLAEGQHERLPWRPSDRLTILVALEVLDNLPHDKIRIRGKHIDQAIVRQNTTTGSSAPHRLEEVFVPLDDALLRGILETCPAYQYDVRYTWIPTVFCGVLQHLRRMRPNLHMVVADFDSLPGPTTAPQQQEQQNKLRSQRAYGEPLVTDMNDADHPCYLSATDDVLCDILFPTDFDLLADFCNAILPRRRETRVETQAAFLQRLGPEHVAATKSWLTGFSPLLGDFGNCSVLTTTTTTTTPTSAH